MMNGTAVIMKTMMDNAERTRAMLLSWVDEYERLLGYGQDPNLPPRTATIRDFWRGEGKPDLDGR